MIEVIKKYFTVKEVRTTLSFSANIAPRVRLDEPLKYRLVSLLKFLDDLLIKMKILRGEYVFIWAQKENPHMLSYKSKNPAVSVIIPTYNRAKLLPRAIKSVLNQTYQDFELIVVDDASTDNTEKVVKEFQEKDGRIRYIQYKKNKGGSAARNSGIKAAKGEYIAFQDSDDEWLPEKLEKQMKVFENVSPEVGVVYTAFWRVDSDKKTIIPSSWVKQKEGNIHKELLRGNFVTTPSIVARKECFEKAGMFDEKLPRLQDWELVIRFSKYYNFKYINEPLLYSFFTANSISANQNALIKARKLILNKHSKEFYKDKRLTANYQYSIGSLLCQNGKTHQGREYLFRAIKSFPLNPKYLVATLTSLFGGTFYRKVVALKHKIQSMK